MFYLALRLGLDLLLQKINFLLKSSNPMLKLFHRIGKVAMVKVKGGCFLSFLSNDFSRNSYDRAIIWNRMNDYRTSANLYIISNSNIP